MKILCTSSGGGNFYAALAISQSIERIAGEQNLAQVRTYYAAREPYDELALFESHITFIKLPLTNKKGSPWQRLRLWVTAVWQLFLVFPDVVVSTGDHRVGPVLRAARFLRIPVVHHVAEAEITDFDKKVAKYARRISTTYREAAETLLELSPYVASPGHPVRPDITKPIEEGAREYLKLEPDIPVILVLGGVGGSPTINQTMLPIAPELVTNYQVIHQTGTEHLASYQAQLQVDLVGNPFAEHYQTYGFLDTLALRMATGVADIIICPVGSLLHELAIWGLPAIIIPTKDDASSYQIALATAYEYAEGGGATVIEKTNLHPHVLLAEIRRITTNPNLWQQMATAAKNQGRPQAARNIAEEILFLTQTHDTL